MGTVSVGEIVDGVYELVHKVDVESLHRPVVVLSSVDEGGHNRELFTPEDARRLSILLAKAANEAEGRTEWPQDDAETLRLAADQMRAALDRAESDNAALRVELRRRAAAERSLRAQLGGSHAVRTPDVAEHVVPAHCLAALRAVDWQKAAKHAGFPLCADMKTPAPRQETPGPQSKE